MIRVRAPASSANLGPGYDVLACGLDLHIELEVEEAGDFSVTADDPAIPADESNLCVRAFAEIHGVDGLAFTIRNPIPVGAGLGSSGAAIVAGLVAADRMFGRGLYGLSSGTESLLDLASALEGHPDNVAASLYGGFVICAGGDGKAVALGVPEGLEGIAVIPAERVATAQARAALPGEVPLADAVFNVARSSMLVLGLARCDWEMVASGLDDRLHQPRRAHLYPRSMDLVHRARGLGALGATISGAGPAVLVWAERSAAPRVADRLREEVGGWAEVRPVRFAAAGAEVVAGP